MLGQKDTGVFLPSGLAVAQRGAGRPAVSGAGSKGVPVVWTVLPPTAASPPPKQQPQFGAGRGRRVEIRCDGCGYGGVVDRLPGRWPMCGGARWHSAELRDCSSATAAQMG